MENAVEQPQEILPQQDDESVIDEAQLNKKYLKIRDYVFFSLAQFASSAITGLVQGYLLFYYTVCVGIDPTAVGTMFLVSKIFDAVIDPSIGIIIDKTRSRWGKMRPYMIFASIPWGVITIAVFMPVTGFSSAGKIAYMWITYILYCTVSSLVGVPMGGIPAVASPNTQERTRLISISRILGSIGEQSALVLISFGLLFSNNYTVVYLLVAIVIGVLGTLFMVLGSLSIKERLAPTVEKLSWLEGFKYLFKNRQFLLLILSNLLTFFRNLVSASIIYVVTYIFNDGSLQIAFSLPGAVASMIGMLIAPKLKQKMDAKQLFIFATIWHSVALALVYIIYIAGGDQWITIAAVMFIAMLPVGILNVVPHLMATDTLDYWEEKTGNRNEGITFAIMSLRSNMSSAFKDYFLSWLLVFFLFAQPEGFLNDHHPVQSQFTQSGLFLMYTLIPAVLNLISIVPMLFYKLSGKKMAEIQSRLAERRLAEGEILDDDGNVVTAESLAVEKGESAEVTADESPLTQTIADAMIAENTLAETVSGEEKGGQSDEA